MSQDVTMKNRMASTARSLLLRLALTGGHRFLIRPAVPRRRPQVCRRHQLLRSHHHGATTGLAPGVDHLLHGPGRSQPDIAQRLGQ